MIKITLYKRNAVGQLLIWEIWQDSPDTIKIRYGKENGNRQIDSEVIRHGLGGRTRQEQIESRINSRVNRKIDSGYCMEKSEARHGENSLGLPKPMLASKLEAIKDFSYGKNFVQKKYDGHRCLIKVDSGEVFAYSRNGKQIKTIDHILDEFKHIDGDLIFDGELYHHGTPLQTISSWVRKKQENTKKIKFICYDVIENQDYDFRFHFVKKYISRMENSLVAETDLLIGEFDIERVLDLALDSGYEGLIIRPMEGIYEVGKRSKNLIKVKRWDDDEYVVRSISESTDGYAIFHLTTDQMRSFSVLCHGDAHYKKKVFENKFDFINKKINIKHFGFTKDGIPFHPIAVGWRDKDAE